MARRRGKERDKEHALRQLEEGAVLEHTEATGWFIWPGAAKKIGWSYETDSVVDDTAIDELVQEGVLETEPEEEVRRRGGRARPHAKLTGKGRLRARALRGET